MLKLFVHMVQMTKYLNTELHTPEQSMHTCKFGDNGKELRAKMEIKRNQKLSVRLKNYPFGQKTHYIVNVSASGGFETLEPRDPCKFMYM